MEVRRICRFRLRRQKPAVMGAALPAVGENEEFRLNPGMSELSEKAAAHRVLTAQLPHRE